MVMYHIISETLSNNRELIPSDVITTNAHFKYHIVTNYSVFAT